MEWTVLAQIVVAAGLGAAIGLERELGAQPAGLRTHMLVSLGAAVFSLAGTDLIGSDPARIAAQVVTGVGFLGGGAILREGATVRGLTTAASLWVTAAIGVAVGLERWFAAVATAAVALGVLWLMKYVERVALPRRRVLEVTLTLEAGAPLDEVEHRARAILGRGRVLRLLYTADRQALVLTARTASATPLTLLGDRLQALPGVHGVDISH
jgi:putative Mg2+ transporter-C (MgtC) family protein